MDYIMHGGELYHYGVLGMKWGVRRGRVTKAYGKASKKLDKLDRRVDKSLENARAARSKADKKMESRFTRQKTVDKAEQKARAAMRDAVIKANKARKWLQAMERTFEGTSASLSKEQVAMGRKYTETLDRRTFQ